MRHRLEFDDLFEDEYELIAIHCSMEIYRMAYMLNAHLNVSFRRKEKDLDFTLKGKKIHYALYEFDNLKKHHIYQLVCNSTVTTEFKSSDKSSNNILFDKGDNRHFLIPELKCDFLIKISSESGRVPVKEIVSKINEIKQVISVYAVDPMDLKSRNNLIFE